MPEPAPTETYSPLWHWGPLEFDGLFGIHGPHLCFHRHPDPSSPDAIVDPAKDIIPLKQAEETKPA